MTVVALTTATAMLPGSRFNSRTASALINETTVNGPHCISTWAMTCRHHFRDEAGEPVAGRTADGERVLGRRRRVGPREVGQNVARDDFSSGRVVISRQDAGVDPSPDAVVADSQKFGRLADANHRHGARISADTVELVNYDRICGAIVESVAAQSVEMKRCGINHSSPSGTNTSR